MNEDILKEIEQMRVACKQNDDKRDANLPLEIPEVTRIDDLSYGPDPKWHLLDLYLPKMCKKIFPSLYIFMVAAGFTAPKKLTNFTACL